MPNRFIGHSVSDGDGTILTMDQAVADFIHRRLDDIIGRNFADLTHPDDVAANVKMVNDLSSRAGPMLVRKRYLRPGASPVDASLQVSRLMSRDGEHRLIGTIFAVEPVRVPTHAMRLQESAQRNLSETRMRAQQFGLALFSDQGWEILLEIYLAESEGRLIRPDDIAATMREPVATIWRWLMAFEASNLIEPVVKVAFAIQLTNDGYTKIERQLTMQATTLPLLNRVD
ncbi:MAG: PAS domain-containing protein [Sphingomonas bacterium]|nr:PAS domain-containing protein [Sphingomonas bacterium]